MVCHDNSSFDLVNIYTANLQYETCLDTYMYSYFGFLNFGFDFGL